ncbi:MAG TPA: hypothetical protein VG347_10770 [Verrucomicrobiae bacterium]|nr:hypothetical protein [Verrucomicrobiae bacterium]
MELLISILMYFGLPSAYLALRNPFVFKKCLMFALLMSIPLSFFVDTLAAINESWVVPNSVFNFRFFGVSTIEVYLFGLLWVLYAVLFYEYFFFNRRPISVMSPRIAYFACLSLALILYVMFGFLFATRLLYIPYFYLLVGVAFVIIPLVAFIWVHPYFSSRFIGAGLFFFFLLCSFEIAALSTNQWTFPGTEFVGFVQIYKLRFPIEEVVIWMCLATPSLLSYYEYFGANVEAFLGVGTYGSAARPEILDPLFHIGGIYPPAFSAADQSAKWQLELVYVVQADILLLKQGLHPVEKPVVNQRLMADTADIVVLIAKCPAGIKRVGENFLDAGNCQRSRNLFDFNLVVLFGQHFIRGAAAARWGGGQPLLIGKTGQIGERPIAGGVVLEEFFEDGSTLGVKWLVLHGTLVEIANGGFIGHHAAFPQAPVGQTYLFAGDTGMVLGKHAVNVHVERPGTCFVVIGIHEPDINVRSHEFADDGVVAFVATQAIPAEADDALEQAQA